MDMPCRLDHLETISLYKEAINWVDTVAHSAIKIRLEYPQDFHIPMERTKYERTEAAITREKVKLRKAQEFFPIHNERFGHVFTSSGLREQYQPGTPSVSLNWALINIYSSRISKNNVSFHLCHLNHFDAN